MSQRAHGGWVLALALLPCLPGQAQERPFERTEERADCAHYEPLRRPFFGDTHVHTTYSFDAWGQGTRNAPRDAYRFAKGEPLGIQPYDSAGRPLRTVQLRRPLDFAVVTDHAELLGETHLCRTPGSAAYDAFVCRLMRRWPKLGYMIINSQMFNERDPVRYAFCGESGAVCREAAAGPWNRIQEAAEEAYDRSAACRFTSFVGYEWSGNPDSNMVHRNVVFRNAVVPAEPANYIDDKNEFGFWRRLERECLGQQNGCDVIAIPHNSNVSGGELFPTVRPDGQPITRADAERRSALERLVEVTQHKGDSECRAGGSDELCGFETLPYATIDQSAGRWLWSPVPSGVYVREVLIEGLAQHERLGANPFQLGMIGSTDTHLGTPGLVSEDQFVGHAAGTVSARLEVPPLPDDAYFNPGGLAVVWAEENSRDALFEAMRRRETYGTSGPRLTVRFFGGWSYAEDLCSDPRFVEKGYAAGVPMGRALPPAPRSREPSRPSFAVWALQDPGSEAHPGTPLQRIQIVKGWVEDGRARERVFEVAGDPHNGAAVDPTTCAPTGPGFSDLCAVWRDPEFDPSRPALYYARVVENPSCRWSAHACLRHGVDCSEPARVPSGLAACCDPEIPRAIQERAWTSPIWYTPAR
jgi:hypothetical protein